MVGGVPFGLVNVWLKCHIFAQGLQCPWKCAATRQRMKQVLDILRFQDVRHECV